jgi:hypothetical protein
MKLEIQDALSSLIPPEQMQIISDVVDTLLEKDYGLALDELNQVLMMADDMADSSMLVARVQDILTYAMNYCLNDYGITLGEDASLKLRHDIYKTLIYIPHYIIPDDLAHIFNSDYDNQETIAQIVPYFTDHPADVALEHIEEVSDNIIGYLRESINARLKTQGEYVGGRVDADRVKVINRLLHTNEPGKFSMMVELANAGVRVGRPYEELINLSFEQLEGRNPVEAAAQMVGLAFFSDLPIGGIWRQIDTSLDDYTDNPMERRIMLDEIGTIKRNVGNLDEAT